DVELSIRVKHPVENAVLIAGNHRKKYKILVPSEIVKIPLKSSDLGGYFEGGELEISCQERSAGK
ncbi:hypothetical protein ACFLYL_05115, partial [Chloroflexota bacterium]